MLMHEDKLSVLLDWETAAIGNPAQDLGYIADVMMQVCDWKDFMAAYVAAGGPSLSQQQIDYYRLWGYTWVNTLTLQATAAFEAGMINDLRAGILGTNVILRTETRLRNFLFSLL